MTCTQGWLFIVTGTLIAIGGVVQSLRVLADPKMGALCGTVIFVGLVTFGLGVASIRSDTDESSPCPENALNKTDSRFGTR